MKEGCSPKRLKINTKIFGQQHEMLNKVEKEKNSSLKVFLIYPSTQLPTIILLNHLHQSSLQLFCSDNKYRKDMNHYRNKWYNRMSVRVANITVTYREPVKQYSEHHCSIKNKISFYLLSGSFSFLNYPWSVVLILLYTSHLKDHEARLFLH